MLVKTTVGVNDHGEIDQKTTYLEKKYIQFRSQNVTEIKQTGN